jgi:hypothetical protein
MNKKTAIELDMAYIVNICYNKTHGIHLLAVNTA